MAHLRNRHISEPFHQMLKFARITGVIGHRQTGKSTFVEANSSEYCTLDDRGTLKQAQQDPVGFIDQLKGRKSAIDECQLAPKLFPALKVKIGTSSVPGRYILSGSVRFSSRNAIRESLTGRLVNQEMLPLVLTELDEVPNSRSVKRLLEASSLSSVIRQYQQMTSIYRERKKWIEKYFQFGGLPTLCFVRSEQTRRTLLKDLLDTILDRDIRLVYPTTVPLEQIRELCRHIARSPMQPLNYEEMRRETDLSPATIKKLLNAMESVFLIRRISLLGGLRGDLFWFEDQLERGFFANKDVVSDFREADWVGLLYRNIRAQFTYRVGEFADYFHYQTRGGASVPLIVRSSNKYLGFFVVKNKTEITRSIIASAESFLKKFENARVLIAILEENRTEMITERIAVMPLCSLIYD